jgi:glycosyltransferase involved in cell wall biosynthesis
MPGLFIQRQAEAITPFCDVAVIYIHPDPECPNKYEVDFAEENEVRVLRVYYLTAEKGAGLLGTITGLFRFYRATMKAVDSIKGFNPEVVHAHVLTRMGFMAWRIGRKLNIPYVISEHWSRYFPANNTYRGLLRKLVTRFVTGRAAAVLPVSVELKSAMLQAGLLNKNYRVIPNLVDQSGFRLTKIPAETKKTLLHISCFEDKSKNISGLLLAIQKLATRRTDFICRLVGDGPDFDKLKQFAESLGLKEPLLEFTGLKLDDELVTVFSQADFLVVSSRYETFGTVIVESLSCGLPVVSTSVGIAPEIIDSRNGMIVPAGDENALMETIDRMLDQCRHYSREEVRSTIAGKFDKEKVGEMISNVYSQVLRKS